MLSLGVILSIVAGIIALISSIILSGALTNWWGTTTDHIGNKSGNKSENKSEDIPTDCDTIDWNKMPKFKETPWGGDNTWDCPDLDNSVGEAMCRGCESFSDMSCENTMYCTTGASTTDWYKKCCQVDGCFPTANFNWIIGTCLDMEPKRCGCCGNHPTELEVNYVGSYQYDETQGVFVCQQKSSFNMDGSQDPWVAGSDSGGNWMPGPNSGGAANWTEGYYPGGRGGVSGPAFAFIISVSKIINSCFYALNQSILDIGPDSDSGKCGAQGNTWECNNSGEFDIVEPVCYDDKGVLKNEDKGFATGWTGSNLGQYGRCMFWSVGTSGGQTGGGGWGDSSKYFMMDTPGDYADRVFFCVIDQAGMRVYQVPTDEDEKYWKGIRKKSADMWLCPFPNEEPSTAPCKSKTEFCATFAPSCGTNDPAKFDQYYCQPSTWDASGIDRGYCGNVFYDKLKFLGEDSLWDKESGPAKAKFDNDGEMCDPDARDYCWYAGMENPPS